MTARRSADDELARAHELADQAAKLIKAFGKRLAALAADFEAELDAESWNTQQADGREAWEHVWAARGLDGLWDRLDDLHVAVGDAAGRAGRACPRAGAERYYRRPVGPRARAGR